MANDNANIPISGEEYKKVTEELYKQNLEVVRLYKQVENLNHELEIANEGQVTLLHIMNHQIKGYLSKSRNIFSELLTEPEYKACTEESRPLLDEGFRSLTEGVSFITDFLNASNIDRGTYKYDMRPLDFKNLVLEVAEKQRGVAEEKGLLFEIYAADGVYNVRGDKAQLEQAVRNLIDNSIRYTPKGGLNVSLESLNNEIILTVKDTGIGISEELKSKLFTKGGRGKDSLKFNVNSTGYGLVFVKDVSEAHGGNVHAESEGEGRGSAFYMKLPVVK